VADAVQFSGEGYVNRAGLAVCVAVSILTIFLFRHPSTVAAGPPARPGVPVLLASHSDFAAGCNGAQTGTNYAGSAVEPSLAVDPGSPAHLVAGWQQDRWSNEGASGIVAAASFDGGRTWKKSTARFSLCTGGTFQRATDPWVSIGPDGTTYQIGMGLNDSDNSKAMFVATSSDGGVTWSDPVTLVRDPNGTIDKPTIAADPRDSRYVYAVWTGRAIASGTQPAVLSRSIDGGKSWEAPQAIYNPSGIAAYDNQVVVLPDGSVGDVFILAPSTGPTSYAMIRSFDHGATWSSPALIANPVLVGTTDPKQAGLFIRGGGDAVGVDRNSGAIYVAWEDGRFSGLTVDGIAFTKSVDGGKTWAAPVQVNQAPQARAFSAAIGVADDGTVAISYYDLRNDTADPSLLLANYWCIHSRDGGNTWSESAVSGPFNYLNAPLETFGNSLFLGDYQGLVASGKTFFTLFPVTNPTDGPNTSRLYVGRVPMLESR